MDHQLILFLVFFGFPSNYWGYPSEIFQDVSHCQVIIAGGSTSALAAAISSANEKISTCLLEPTDWVGGQLSSTGVPAIDFAWHQLKDPVTGFILNVGQIDKQKENVTPSFWQILHNLERLGKCWVSDFCYLPKDLFQSGIDPILRNISSHLHIYYNTVVKNVTTKENQIETLTAIQRFPTNETNCGGYDRFLSQDLEDWYNPSSSNRWKKIILRFLQVNHPSKNRKFSSLIFIDATEWGELLALSKAPYLQGIDERFDGDISGKGNDTCGQSISFGFAEKLHSVETPEPPNPFPVHHPEFYSLDGFTWEKVWRYRRLETNGSSQSVTSGDITLQNWGTGNDEVFGYLFLSKKKTLELVENGEWNGGVSVDLIADAEKLSYGWHYWFKSHNESTWKNKITLNRESLGTCHGLSKIPYIRDSRRSIGIENFVMKVSEISGNATDMVGHIYEDRVAIGAYDIDIHPIQGCDYPSYMKKYYGVLPYFIPLRAMTNQKYVNLLVSGKTMAQSFLVNAATRLHPVEWSSGTATGVIAAYMAQHQLETWQLKEHIGKIRLQIEKYTPTQWTIEGKLYPPSSHS